MEQHDTLRVALDVGNGYTKAALVDIRTPTCIRRETVPTAEACDRLPGIVEGFRASAGVNHTKLDITIAAVVQRLHAELNHRLSARARHLHWVRYHPSLGFSIPYTEPAALGADRVANLLYCCRTFPRSDTVVVSAGTAITVDCLAGGTRFLGGAIMPGLRMQLHSLASATAQLPALELTPEAPSWCGTSTESCIRAGVMRGTAGAVSRLVTDQLTHLASGAHVIATGGAWPFLAELVDFDCRYIDELTLLGTALYPPEEAR